MMHPTLSVATFLIAACAASTGASAQNVYKCGASYSERPCENGVVLPLSERTPTAADKKAMDQATQRDASLANALEKSRLQQERQALRGTKPADDAPAQPSSQARKKALKKKETPAADAFVAHVPAEKKSQKSPKTAATPE